MTILLFLIPIAPGLELMELLAFLWPLWSGQSEEGDGAANRILFDDDHEARALTWAAGADKVDKASAKAKHGY